MRVFKVCQSANVEKYEQTQHDGTPPVTQTFFFKYSTATRQDFRGGQSSLPYTFLQMTTANALAAMTARAAKDTLATSPDLSE